MCLWILEQGMKCPHCGKRIPDDRIARHLASKGGRKSKRTLTPAQARKMVEAREKKKLTDSPHTDFRKSKC